MTSLNALPPLPFCSADPTGSALTTGESSPPKGSSDADDSSDFLQAMLAYFPLAGSVSKEPVLPKDATDSAPWPSKVVVEFPANTGLSTSETTSEAMEGAPIAANGTAFTRDLALEARNTFKKSLATVPNVPVLEVAELPLPPVPVVSSVLSESVGKIAVQDKANANLPVENEQTKLPPSQSSTARTAVEQPISLDRAAEATDKSGFVPEVHALAEARQPMSHGSILEVAMPVGNAVAEVVDDLGSADHSAAAEVRASTGVQEMSDADANDNDAPVAPVEPKRLTNDHANASITHRDVVRPTALADKVHDTFHAHLDQVRQQGRVEVQMDLHPPELGRMQLHITMQDNQLNVRLVVQNDAAKQVLDQQLDPLRIRFAEMGVSLGQLDVRRDSNAPNQQPPSDSERSSSSFQTGQNTANRLRSSYAPARNSSALVDVIA